jgi:hypothetical protein
MDVSLAVRRIFVSGLCDRLTRRGTWSSICAMSSITANAVSTDRCEGIEKTQKSCNVWLLIQKNQNVQNLPQQNSVTLKCVCGPELELTSTKFEIHTVDSRRTVLKSETRTAV